MAVPISQMVKDIWSFIDCEKFLHSENNARVRGKGGAVIAQMRPGSTRQKSGHIHLHQDTACGLVNLISDSDHV